MAESTSQQGEEQSQQPHLRIGGEEGEEPSVAERRHQSVLNGQRTQQLRSQSAIRHENCQSHGVGATTRPDAAQRQEQETQERAHHRVSIGVQPGHRVTFRVGEGVRPQQPIAMENGRHMRVNSHRSPHPHRYHNHAHHHNAHRHIVPLLRLPWPLQDDLDNESSNNPPPWEQVTWSNVLPQVASAWIAGLGYSLRERSELSEEGRNSDGEAIASSYSCPVCLNYLSEPLQGHCRHTICGDCMANVISSSTGSPPKCPICRAPFFVQGVENPISISEEHIRNMLPLSVECVNDGCNARFTPLLSRYHASVCPELIHPCLYYPVGCQSTLRRIEMESHIASCPYKKIAGIFPHVFYPIKQLQDIVSRLSTLDQSRLTLMLDLRHELLAQINELRPAMPPTAMVSTNDVPDSQDEEGHHHVIMTTAPAPLATTSTSTVLQPSRNNTMSIGGSDLTIYGSEDDGEQAVLPNGEDVETLVDSNVNPQALLDSQEDMSSPQDGDQEVISSNTNATENLRTESSSPQTLDAPGTGSDIGVKYTVDIHGLGFELFKFIRHHIGLMRILWNLGGAAVQIEDDSAYTCCNSLEAHASNQCQFFVHMWLSRQYIYFTLSLVDGLDDEILTPQCRYGCARNWMAATLAMLSGVVLSITTYRVTTSIFNGSTWSAVILPVIWYPSFAIQDAVNNRYGKRIATEKSRSTPGSNRVGICETLICDAFFVDMEGIKSRTMTKWAEVGHCLGIANAMFHVSESNLLLGFIMEWACMSYARALFLGGTMVTNDLNKKERVKNELRWWFCIFFFVIAPIFIISSEILFSSTVIFCLQFAMIGWECTVTKFVLHSIPSTANPPTQTDCSNSTPSPMWGNDHALALTRPTFIVSIAAYFSLLVM